MPVHTEMVSREKWGALPPKDKDVELKHPILHVLFTFTGTEECHTKEECFEILRKFQKSSIEEKGYKDIQFNFLVGGDAGIVFEGRGWHTNSPKPDRFFSINEKSLDVAYIGNYPNPDDIPTLPMFRAACYLMELGMDKEYIDFDKVELIPMRALTETKQKAKPTKPTKPTKPSKPIAPTKS